MILELLASQPDEMAVSSDDGEAAEWIAELDLNRFIPPGRRHFMGGWAGHPTHWITFCIFYDFPRPGQLSRTVFCYPRSQYTQEEVTAEFQRMAGEPPLN